LRGDARPRLHWCLTGPFSNIPVHAAGIHNGSHDTCCADFVVSSYTPTVRALLRTQRAATPLKRDNISLALVAEKRALQRHLRIIPGVDEEIEYVAAVASQCNIKTTHRLIGSTTIADTTAVMQVVNCVHLAYHGIQDVGDAAQSGFCLGDGRLTIAKLMDLKLDDAFLAFLSACETAKGDELQPDQAMHLAAAMLFSGFKNVIATMWYVDASYHDQVAADNEQGDIRRGWPEGCQMVLRGASREGGGRCKFGCVRPRFCCGQVAGLRRLSGSMGTIHTHGCMIRQTSDICSRYACMRLYESKIGEYMRNKTLSRTPGLFT
jgi:hypothetical protein